MVDLDAGVLLKLCFCMLVSFAYSVLQAWISGKATNIKPRHITRFGFLTGLLRAEAVHRLWWTGPVAQ